MAQVAGEAEADHDAPRAGRQPGTPEAAAGDRRTRLLDACQLAGGIASGLTVAAGLTDLLRTTWLVVVVAAAIGSFLTGVGVYRLAVARPGDQGNGKGVIAGTVVGGLLLGLALGLPSGRLLAGSAPEPDKPDRVPARGVDVGGRDGNPILTPRTRERGSYRDLMVPDPRLTLPTDHSLDFDSKDSTWGRWEGTRPTSDLTYRGTDTQPIAVIGEAAMAAVTGGGDPLKACLAATPTVGAQASAEPGDAFCMYTAAGRIAYFVVASADEDQLGMRTLRVWAPSED